MSTQPDDSGAFDAGEFHEDPVHPNSACPFCEQAECDRLVWIDDERVRCDSCGTIYDPLTGKVVGPPDRPEGGRDAGPA